MDRPSKFQNRTGGTWSSVAVTNDAGDDIGTIGWISEAVIVELEAQHKCGLTFTFKGGSLDGSVIRPDNPGRGTPPGVFA